MLSELRDGKRGSTFFEFLFSLESAFGFPIHIGFSVCV